MEDEGFNLAQFWLEGGFVMYPVLLSWLAAEASGVVALITKNVAAAMAAIALSSAPLIIGVAGQAYNRAQVDAAIAHVDPADQETIREAGYRESARPLQLGGLATVITLPLAFIAFANARKSQPQGAGGAKSILDNGNL
jgi:hypothetical protein